jgi:hypothetical protein
MAQDTTVHQPTHLVKDEALLLPVVQRPTRKADDATGINVADRKPISPKMPHLPPA